MRRSRENELFSWVFILVTAIMPIVSLVICDIFNIYNNEIFIKSLMKIALFILLIFGVINVKKGTPEKVIFLLLIAGIVMRIGYMLYTDWGVRGHDVGGTDLSSNGHASYILNNLLQGHLPYSNEGQYYHPPLSHALSALFVKIAAVVSGAGNYTDVMKYAMVVPCIASCISLPVFKGVMDELNIKHQAAAIAVAAFFPNFMLMGGRINNDSLVTMFMMLSLLFTIKWFKKPEPVTIIKLALSIGLGMMSKMSGGVVALFTGPLMLYKLYEAFRNKKTMSIIKQLAVFALICFPIALWYPIRNYIEFGQRLAYVPFDIGTWVYTGDRPFFERFLSMPFWTEFTRPYMDMDNDASIFMSITRTAVFGEFSYDVPKIISVSLYFVNLALIVISFASMVYVCVRDKSRDMLSRFSMCVVWLIIMASYVCLNISCPASCTADIRYISVAVSAGMTYLAAGKDAALTDGRFKAARIITEAIVVIYCILVIIMYA